MPNCSLIIKANSSFFYNSSYDISIYSLHCEVNAQSSSQPVLGWSAARHRQSIYLVACLFTQGSQCFSRPPALSHDLPGREQQPTGESVDTVETRNTTHLDYCRPKPLEASCKDKVNINLKINNVFRIPKIGHLSWIVESRRLCFFSLTDLFKK